MRETAAYYEERYQLRSAAGLYWLIDMEQSGVVYTEPVPLNECGARIWRMLAGGMTTARICQWLCGEYALPPEDAMADVQAFVAQLRAKGIDLEDVE